MFLHFIQQVFIRIPPQATHRGFKDEWDVAPVLREAKGPWQQWQGNSDKSHLENGIYADFRSRSCKCWLCFKVKDKKSYIFPHVKILT